MSHGGKGDQPRPFSVAREEFEARWDAIFGNRKSNIQVANSGENETHMSEALATGLRAMVDDMVIAADSDNLPPLTPGQSALLQTLTLPDVHNGGHSGRQWRGLTEDEFEELWGFHADVSGSMCEAEARAFAGTIDAWLRERNA